MTLDLALSENGGEILVATSMENRHPPSHIIDGDLKTFWISTGLYPQDLIVAFPKPSFIESIELRSRHIRHLIIERCETPQPINFIAVDDCHLEDNHDGELQQYQKEVQVAARYLKIRIAGAYDDLVAVHGVRAPGRPY